jgi:peptidoglycan/xylan/chitin deacetylase (PgdA/CDA1 family)
MLEWFKSLAPDAREDELQRLRERTPCLDSTERELLDWSELDQLVAGGIEVEPHGATHELLVHLDDESIEEELLSARDALLAHGHGSHDLLAYPSGLHDERVRAIAKRVGYRAAFTTERGLVSQKSDPLALPRLGVHHGISGSSAEFLHKVPGWA